MTNHKLILPTDQTEKEALILSLVEAAFGHDVRRVLRETSQLKARRYRGSLTLQFDGSGAIKSVQRQESIPIHDLARDSVPE